MSSEFLYLMDADPRERLGAYVQNEDAKAVLRSVIEEYRGKEKIRKFGLSNSRKILVNGKRGVGRTFTARVMAGELRLPFYGVLLHFAMTATDVKELFVEIARTRAVYLFDNVFTTRHLPVSVLTDFIRCDQSDSFIVCSSSPQRWREYAFEMYCFDEIINLDPVANDAMIEMMVKNGLGEFYQEELVDCWLGFAKKNGQKYVQAEIAGLCKKMLKKAIVSGQDKVAPEVVRETLARRMMEEEGLEQ